ncbi:MAG: hypothetical protein RL235_975 [Chlamydiota bacterium]|jgi:hypothetical protein
MKTKHLKQSEELDRLGAAPRAAISRPSPRACLRPILGLGAARASL